MTLKGYNTIFEQCETDAAVFACLANKFNEPDVDIWMSELVSRKMGTRVAHLLNFWDENCERGDLKNKKDYIKYIQIFSLLENVFRNVLLRPYIPAYRTINKNCGRYSSFVTSSEEKLFKALDFEVHSSLNLLTYHGENPVNTIIYAITCSICWHVLTMKLKAKLTTTP